MSAKPGKGPDASHPGHLYSSEIVPVPTGGSGTTRRGSHRRSRPDLSPFALGFSVTLGAIVAVGFVVSLAAMSSVVFNVFAALFIALALNPLVKWLTRAGQSRGRAIFVVALGFALLAGTTLVLVVPPLLRQAVGLARGLPGSIARLSDQPAVQTLNSVTNGGADSAIQWLNDLVGQPSFWAFVAGGALAIGGGIAGWVSSGFFTAVLTLYFLVSLKGMKRGFYSLVSKSKRHTAIYLTEQITDSIGRYLGGMVVLAALNAGFSFVLLTLTRVPYAGLISFAAFFITLIPLIGTVVTTVFMSIFAFLSSPVAGLVVLVAMLVYMQVEAYILTPKAMGRALHIPGATVLISATAGAVLLGFVGALIATPVAAAITLIVRRVVVPRQNAL